MDRVIGALDAGSARLAGETASLAASIGSQGVVFFEVGDFARAQECFLQVLALADSIGHAAYRCDALGYLGLILTSTGDLVGGMSKLNEALAAARRIGDPHRELVQLGAVGHTYLQVANVDDAARTYVLAVQLAKRIGDRQAEAGCLNNLGVIYHNISQPEAMLNTFAQVLQISEAVGDQQLTFNALQYLAKGKLAQGDSRSAVEYARRALDLMRTLGAWGERGAMQDIFISSLVREGRFQEAVGEIQAELGQSPLAVDRERELVLLGQLVDVYYQQGDLAASASTGERALDLAVQFQRRLLEGRLAGRLGAIYADWGDLETSKQFIARAIELAESEQDLQTLAEQYYMLALNAQQSGQIQDAADAGRRSLQVFSRIGCTAQVRQVQAFLGELGSERDCQPDEAI